MKKFYIVAFLVFGVILSSNHVTLPFVSDTMML